MYLFLRLFEYPISFLIPKNIPTSLRGPAHPPKNKNKIKNRNIFGDIFKVMRIFKEHKKIIFGGAFILGKLFCSVPVHGNGIDQPFSAPSKVKSISNLILSDISKTDQLMCEYPHSK